MLSLPQLAGAATTLLGVGGLPLGLMFMRGGAKAFGAWLHTHGAATRERALAKLIDGLKLREAETREEQERCAVALMEGWDEWRSAQDRKESRLRSLWRALYAYGTMALFTGALWCVIGMEGRVATARRSRLRGERRSAVLS